MNDPDAYVKIARILQIPSFAAPWINRFYEPAEIRMIAYAARGPLSRETLATCLRRDGKPYDASSLQTWIDRTLRRAVLDLDDDDRLVPCDFHARFEMWALFEGPADIPADILERLDGWETTQYIEGHRAIIADMKAGKIPPDETIRPRYLLVNETMRLIDLAPAVYLWPCNCRLIARGCSKPVFVCLRFENDRGVGWEISESRAKSIVKSANQAGLMQSGEVGIGARGEIRGAVCNCCSDCCYPHRLADALDAAGLWPYSRYRAVYIEENCIACGLCVRRCPFGAFERAAVSPQRAPGPRIPIRFISERCRGCGLCAETCPESSVRMVFRRQRDEDALSRLLRSRASDPVP
jgi:Pyruvate/2-oxoacid:ferredoxin oxidoreductase delta subunit